MLFKGDTRALGYRPHITGRLLGMSFMTWLSWSVGRSSGLGPESEAELVQHLTRYVVLPVCSKWAEVTYAAKRTGRPIQTADARIAASSLCYQLTHHQQSKRLCGH